MPTPGLVFARATVTSPDLSDEVFNKWYNEVHVPDVLKAGLGDLGLRYSNLDPTAKYQYCAMYRTPEIENANPTTLSKIPLTSSMLPGSGNFRELIKIQVLRFELIQRFEGQGSYAGRGEGVIAVAVEPADDEDFDEWYRKQHLDMLSLGKGYIRSTRYKLLEGLGYDPSVPRFLTLHEYETTDFPDTTLVRGTEWSKKVLSSAKAFERDAWKLIFQSGDEKL